MYQIKEISRITGLTSDTIRYYERIGVLPAPDRAANGYRIYTDDDLQRLRFVSQARQLDLPLSQITEIVVFRDKGMPPCSYVQELIHAKIDEVDLRIGELKLLRKDLVALDENALQLELDIQQEACICQIIESGMKKGDRCHGNET